VGAAGRRHLVDPQGPVRTGRRPGGGRPARVPEETGSSPPPGPLADLGTFRLPSGKLLRAYAAEGDFDPLALASNLFRLEWPPRSGRVRAFPEADRAGWFSPTAARVKLLAGQRPVLDALLLRLRKGG